MFLEHISLMIFNNMLPICFLKKSGKKNLYYKVSFYVPLEKDEKHHEMCMNIPKEHEKTEKVKSNPNWELEILSETEQRELRGSRCRFFKYMVSRVIKFEE